MKNPDTLKNLESVIQTESHRTATFVAMTEELVALMKRYRRSPEFVFADLADVNSTGMTGDTLLHTAVIRSSAEDVDLLIRSGAKVNAQGDLGNTPLHHAASRGLLDIANKLIASGAKMHLKNEFGQTPADLATLMKHNELAKRLQVK